MISFLLIFLAAIFNSICDNLAWHYYKSVFKKFKNPDFFDPNVSWKTEKKIFGWKFDAWHISKSCMLILLFFAIKYNKTVFDPIIDIVLCGLIWNGTFNLFFNRLLNCK